MPDQTSTPISLTANCVISGVFYPSGSALPFSSVAELPESLKAFVARGDEEVPPFNPAARNIYLSDYEPRLRPQVWKLALAKAEHDLAEEAFDRPVREDIAEALQSAHDRYVGRQLAEAENAANLADAAREQAEQASRPRELFVKRGGEYGRSDRCRLKPGELIFARMPNGEFESVGRTNHNAEVPIELTYEIQS